MTPSGFLFSRLLAAVEKEQDDRERGEGEKESVDGWNHDAVKETINAPVLTVCEIDGSPA